LKVFATGVVKVQLPVLDEWYNIDSYWQPAYESTGLDVTIQRRIDGKRIENLATWVKSIGREGSVAGFRKDQCELSSGVYSLF
jgi:hypothetical protein